MLKSLDVGWALNADLPELDFVLPGLLPGSFGLIVAPGSTGKSFFALDIAVSIAIGRPVAGGVLPAPVNAGKVVFLMAEEDKRMVAERLRQMLSQEERKNPALSSNLLLFPRAGQAAELIDANYNPTELFNELLKASEGARLIIVDPIRRLHAGDENNSCSMTSFVMLMEKLARETGAAVVGLHHANRSSAQEGAVLQNASRGSSALVDGARWQLNMSKMDEKTASTLHVDRDDSASYVALDFVKTNYLEARPRCWLKREAGGRLMLDSSLSQIKAKKNIRSGFHTV